MVVLLANFKAMAGGGGLFLFYLLIFDWEGS
jgi:hypothetical protein